MFVGERMVKLLRKRIQYPYPKILSQPTSIYHDSGLLNICQLAGLQQQGQDVLHAILCGPGQSTLPQPVARARATPQRESAFLSNPAVEVTLCQAV